MKARTASLIALAMLLSAGGLGSPVQAHDVTDCGIAATSPADGASFTLDQYFTHLGVVVVDASAVFKIEVYADGVLLGFREFDPFYLDDDPSSTVPLPTSVPGTHTIDWKMYDASLNVCVHSHTYQVVNPNDPDADDDGLYDSIDTDPLNPSVGFDDGTHFGEILDRNGFTVTVQDDPAPGGFAVTVAGVGPGKASFEMCGSPPLLKLAPGEYHSSCGSVIVSVVSGEAEFDLGDGSTVTVPAGGSAEVGQTDTDTFLVENLGTTPLEIVVDGTTATIAAGETHTVTSWTFEGFSSPVDNPEVQNVLKAGQVVPLKWRLLGSDGSPVTSLPTVSIHATSVNCADGTSADQVEEFATGGSGLQNLGDGYYQLNWATPKSYARSCKTLHIDLGEGITRDALFRFPR